jgi:hypothetical protein
LTLRVLIKRTSIAEGQESGDVLKSEHGLSQLSAVRVRSLFQDPGSDRIGITFRVLIGIRIQGVADAVQVKIFDNYDAFDAKNKDMMMWIVISVKKRKTNFRFSNNVHIWVMCSIRIQDLDQHQNGKSDGDPDPQSSYMYVHYSINLKVCTAHWAISMQFLGHNMLLSSH